MTHGNRVAGGRKNRVPRWFGIDVMGMGIGRWGLYYWVSEIWREILLR